MSVTAKFKVHHVEEFETSRVVHMAAVYSSDTTSENYSWSQATPGGVIQMNITNPAAFNQFEVGHEYLVNFTDVTAAQDQTATTSSTTATTDTAAGQDVADTANSTTDTATATGASADTSTNDGTVAHTAADAAPAATTDAAQTTTDTSVNTAEQAAPTN